VHCYGIAADIDKINKFTKKKKIFLIEDICLNFGGKIKDKYFGSFGDASIISFGADKILNIGGGALIIKKKSIYDKVKKFLIKNPFFSDINLDKKKIKEKINLLNKNINDRNLNAKYLHDNILSKSFIKPKHRKNDVYWRYPMITKINRNKLIRDAKKKGIIITSHYPSINRFQYNSNLKNADIFDKSVINIFVKKQKSKNYLKKVCNFLNRK
jgi:dTDP-4-amino-4,6-dideoxygalactose transaminase